MEFNDRVELFQMLLSSVNAIIADRFERDTRSYKKRMRAEEKEKLRLEYLQHMTDLQCEIRKAMNDIIEHMTNEEWVSDTLKEKLNGLSSNARVYIAQGLLPTVVNSIFRLGIQLQLCTQGDIYNLEKYRVFLSMQASQRIYTSIVRNPSSGVFCPSWEFDGVALQIVGIAPATTCENPSAETEQAVYEGSDTESWASYDMN